MEWDLDRHITEEIQRQALPLQLVARPEDADFVMTSMYQGLNSRMISAGHYIQARIVAAGSGNPVWTAEANDYALFFGRLRSHGPGRAAKAIVKQLRNSISATGR